MIGHQVGQVLAVLYDDALVRAPVGVQIYVVIVPAVLAAPKVQKRSLRTAQRGADALRRRALDSLAAGLIGVARERCVRKKGGHDARRCACVTERLQGHAGEVIGYVLRIHSHHAVDRLADPVDPEDLVITDVPCFALDQSLGLDLLIRKWGYCLSHKG